MRGLAFLGGSFNPPHIGHFRLALEVVENFADLLSGLVFLPCARPPHKAQGTLLPFADRSLMLERVVSDIPELTVSRLESERPDLSYTWDTLALLGQAYPGVPLYFVLGADDYCTLDTWYRGRELPLRTSFLVVPRGHFGFGEFCGETRRIWPDARIEGDTVLFRGGGSARFYRADVPSVSATDVRARFLAGKSIRFLVPDFVRAFLLAHADSVSSIWGRR